MEHDLPPDPDLDDMPRELEEHPGPLYFGLIDPASGAVYPLRRITREQIAAMLAERSRRLRIRTRWRARAIPA